MQALSDERRVLNTEYRLEISADLLGRRTGLSIVLLPVIFGKFASGSPCLNAKRRKPRQGLVLETKLVTAVACIGENLALSCRASLL